MRAEYEIEDLATLKVFSDPTRLAVLQLLAQPRSVGELARELDAPRTRLYHHVNLMEEHGLIEVVETRTTGRLPEHVYRAVAHAFRPSAALTESGDIATQLEVMLGAVFDVTRADFQRAVLSRASDVGMSEQIGLSRQVVRMRPERAKEFLQRLEDLVTELDGAADGDDGAAFAFTWAFYPSSLPAAGPAS